MKFCRILTLSLSLCIGLLFAASSEAYTTTLIDFNDGEGGGSGWNTFNEGHHQSTMPLNFDDGSPSGVWVTLPSYNDSGGTGWDPSVELPSWASTGAAADYSMFNGFCCDGGSQTVQFLFSNLNPDRLYQFDVLISRDLDRSQDISVTHGRGVWSHLDWNARTDGWTAGHVLRTHRFWPDASNEIKLEFRRHGTSGSFNAIRIKSLPEPKTLALMTFGILGLILGRRQRSR